MVALVGVIFGQLRKRMTAPLCKCGCNKPVERRSYETDRQWNKRKELGIFRNKCKKSLPHGPAKKDRPKPTLSPVSVNYGRGGGMEPRPKELTPRDAAYLDWIRTFDCIECGWPAHLKEIEAHHIETGGGSLRCSDYLAVPLCSFKARGCHAKADKTPTSVEKYKPWALRFNALWISVGNKIKKG
jgi:hypothetical protein